MQRRRRLIAGKLMNVLNSNRKPCEGVAASAAFAPEAAGVLASEAALPAPTSIFHERWWLNATTAAGELGEAAVESGGKIAGWLPFVRTRQLWFRVLAMPQFTHVLGPVVAPGSGKAQTQFMRRKSIVRALIAQLPHCGHFRQVLSASDADGLAFQECGFTVTPQYTFTIDCRGDLAGVWDAMHFKVRQHIRRAESRLGVATIDNPDDFVGFYEENLARLGRKNTMDFGPFPTLFSECRRRDAGELLCASRPDGTPAAMVFLIWGHGSMYYFMSMRAPEASDSGAINLLVWSALQRAHARGLVLDLDGITTIGTSRFLSGFGGEPKMRLVVRRSRAMFGAMQWAKRNILPNDGSYIFK
jgi:hypothetical protein